MVVKEGRREERGGGGSRVKVGDWRWKESEEEEVEKMEKEEEKLEEKREPGVEGNSREELEKGR